MATQLTQLNYLEHSEIVDKFADIAGYRNDGLEDWKEAKNELENLIDAGEITLAEVERMYENDESYDVPIIMTKLDKIKENAEEMYDLLKRIKENLVYISDGGADSLIKSMEKEIQELIKNIE